jgi:hypothetical protein
MNARLISAALVAAVMSLLWFFSQRHNTSIEARVREMETGVPAWDAGTAKDAVSKANESRQAAMQTVAARQ